jgi:mono/diheme cytochrome c family protein
MTAWRIAFCIVLFALLADTAATAAERVKANPKTTGKAVYMARCEACHMMGMNVIKPGKDIVVSSKLVSLDEFKAFLTEPHGVMPAFEELANDSETVRALYKFTKKLKHQNWTYDPPIENQPAEPSQPPQKRKAGDNRKPTE